MSFKTLVNKGLNFFGLSLERTIASLGNPLAFYGIKKEEYCLANNKIFLKALSLTIPFSNASPVLEGYQNALELSKKEGVKFISDKDEKPGIQINNLKFKINDQEELFILREVFVEGAYNLIAATEKKIALIDIGMNVGITSLFYAAQDNVDTIFSFEPFLPTFKMATDNLKLNEVYARKIEANNFGLAKEAGELSVSYSLNEKGRMGLNGLPKTSDIAPGYVSRQTIVLKSVSDQFLKIRNKISDHFIVCKMDCEGAEYEIIDSLFNTEEISLPDVYFIEWHYKKPANIVSKLVEFKYNVIHTTFKTPNSGMIYAIKNNN